MGKTIRRKNVPPDDWVTYNWDFSLGYLIKRRKEEKSLKKDINKYRSDSTYTMEHYPAWFRRALNRRLRTQQSRAVHRIVRDYEDQICVPKFIKNGLWEWW